MEGDRAGGVGVAGGNGRGLAVALALTLALCLLRLIHLGADTPPGLSWSAGIYVDEGYKTLSPRNLALFGQTHWNAFDDYPGWMKLSPLTQWSFYASFRLFGPTLEAARVVTIGYFGLLLAGFAWALSRRYPPGLLAVGVLLLGVESTLFFLSRIAIFEIPIATFVCGLLFALARLEPRQWRLALILTVGLSALLVFGIKISALLYLLPVACGLGVFVIRARGLHRSRSAWALGAAAAVALGLLLFVTRSSWLWRAQIAPLGVAHRILANPLVGVSGFTVLLGLLCAVHALLCMRERFLGDLYRISLLALVVLGLPILALFEYNPLRYYVPLLPAYLLLLLEWIHLEGWRYAPDRGRSAWIALAFPVAFVGLCIAAQLFNLAVLRPLSLPLGDEPGLADETVLRLSPPLALVVALALFRLRALALGGRALALALALTGMLFCADHALSLGAFLRAPSYQARDFRAALVRALPAGRTLAGDWAPFFALGTDIRALYVADIFNHPSHLSQLAPDYFLHASTATSETTRRAIESLGDVKLGAPVLRGEYNRTEVVLYPLVYEPVPAAGEAVVPIARVTPAPTGTAER